MTKQKVRFITFAWGRKYVDHVLKFNLPAVLSPGNLPCIAKECDCEAVILTEEKYFSTFEAHPAFKNLQEIVPVRLVSLDDLISYPWSYGLSLTQALFRGFSDLGLAMTDTFLLFLNADFILAENSYRNLLPKLRDGECLIMSPSYCTNAESVAPELRRRTDVRTGTLTVPHREMAELILENRHNTIKGKTANQQLFSMDYIEQFYWNVDDQTLICRQMPFAVVGMKPQRALTELKTIWDYGIISEACPNVEPCVLSDSDDFLMLELREENEHFEKLTPGWPTPKSIADGLATYMSGDQRKLGEYTLVLHSGELPDNFEAAKKKLCGFAEQVFNHLPAEMHHHLNHPQWLFHHDLFNTYQKNYNENSAVETSGPTEVPSTTTTVPHASKQLPLTMLKSALIKIKKTLFGRYPFVTPLHPYWIETRLVLQALKENPVKPTDRVLIVYSSSLGCFELVPQTKERTEVRTKDCKDSADLNAILAGQEIDFCFCDLDHQDFVNADQILSTLRERMGENGRLIVFMKSRTPTGIGRESLLELFSTLSGTGASQVRFCGNRFHKNLGWALAQKMRNFYNPRSLVFFYKLWSYIKIVLHNYISHLYKNTGQNVFPDQHCLASVFVIDNQPDSGKG